MAIQYFLNGSGGTNSDCTPAVGNNERAVVTAAEESTSITRTVPTLTTDEISLSWTTPTSNPNSSDWPNGTYDGSVDLSSVDANLTIKAQLYRINSSCTTQQQIGLDSTGVSVAGVYTFSFTIDPSAGAAGDRYQLRLLGTNSNSHNTRSFTVAIGANTWIRGPWVVATFDPAADAFRFYEDGSESGSAPIDSQDTDITRTIVANSQVQLRYRVQETGGASGASTDDWQLQYSRNGGSYTNVTASSSFVQADTASSLSDGSATTNRGTNGISDGTGSFVAGEQEAGNGEITDSQLTASNFTEHVWGLRLIYADLADGDTLDFRIALNGGSPGMTNSVTPTITIDKPELVARAPLVTKIAPASALAAMLAFAPVNLLTTTLSAPAEPDPVRPIEWVVPKGAEHPTSLFTHINQTKVLVEPIPFNQYDWPNPRGPDYPVSLRTHLQFTKIIPEPSPFYQTDWPVPKGQEHAISLRTHLQSPTVVETVPFSQADWPVPKGGRLSRTLLTSTGPGNTLVNRPFDPCPAGPGLPNTVTQYSGGDGTNPWANIDKSLRSDDLYSTVTLTGVDVSYWLRLTNFGFNLAPTKLVLGIVVEIESKVSTGSSQFDTSLTLSGSQIGGHRFIGVNTTEQFNSGGGASDTWGRNWVVSEINSSTFGVEFQVFDLLTYSVDSVRVTVYCEDQQPPGAHRDFQNPVVDKPSIERYTYTLNLQQSTLAPAENPTSQRDWPVPISPVAVAGQSGYTQSRVPQPVPFAQYGWPNPIAPVRTPGQADYTVGRIPQPVAFYQTAWPNPRGADDPSDNRTWIHQTPIQLIAEEAPIRPVDLPTPISVEQPNDRLSWVVGRIPQPVPGVQTDWPNPIVEVRSVELLTIALGLQTTTLAPAAETPIAPVEWPNPLSIDPDIGLITLTSSLQTTTLAPEVGNPFAQYNWPVPAGELPKDFAHSPYRPATTAPPAPGEKPFKQDDWPNPVIEQRSISLITWAGRFDLGTLATVPELPAGRQTDWQNPLEPDQIFHEFNVPLNTLSAGAPHKQIDWPNPNLGAEHPIELRTWLWQAQQQLIGQDELPFRQLDWQNPIVPPPPLDLLTLTVDIARFTLSEVQAPFKQSEWPNPLIPQDPASSLAIAEQTRLPLVDVKPIAPVEWPNPQAQVPVIDSFSQGLLTTLLAVEEQPTRQLEWPNPIAVVSRLDTAQANLLSTTLAAPAQPGAQHEWPNPILEHSSLVYISDVQSTPQALTDVKPFSQNVWTNPIVDRSRIDLLRFEQQLLQLTLSPTGDPFYQHEWPNPIGPERSIDLLSWQDRSKDYFSESAKPFSQSDWPNPVIVAKSIDPLIITQNRVELVSTPNPQPPPPSLFPFVERDRFNTEAKQFKATEFFPPNPALTTLVIQITPTGLRVESIFQWSNVLRWTYLGTAAVEIYRAPFGGSFAVIDAVIDPTVTIYEDITASGGVRYEYKLSDDGGATFSNTVNVVTQEYPSPAASNQSTTNPLLPRFITEADINPEVLTQLASQVEASLSLALGQHADINRCEACIENGAVILDCGSGCVEFEVIVNEDVNSITVVGCETCPNVRLIIPEGLTHVVCGWPPVCGFTGDECAEPITGPAAVGQDGEITSPERDYDIDPSCACPISSIVVEITCCEDDDDCSVTCSHPSAKLKACGGYPPYSWSSTGDVRLSGRNGPSVIASKKQEAIPGVFPGQIAFFNPSVNFVHQYIPLGCGGNDQTLYSVTNTLGPAFDCDMNPLGTIGGYTGNQVSTLTVGGCAADPAPSGGVYSFSDTVCFSGICQLELELNYTPASPIWSEAPNVVTTVDLPSTPGFPLQNKVFSGLFDIRTQAMVDGGCGCTDTPITVTVTDRLGGSATVILA